LSLVGEQWAGRPKTVRLTVGPDSRALHHSFAH